VERLDIGPTPGVQKLKEVPFMWGGGKNLSTKIYSPGGLDGETEVKESVVVFHQGWGVRSVRTRNEKVSVEVPGGPCLSTWKRTGALVHKEGHSKINLKGKSPCSS